MITRYEATEFASEMIMILNGTQKQAIHIGIHCWTMQSVPNEWSYVVFIWMGLFGWPTSIFMIGWMISAFRFGKIIESTKYSLKHPSLFPDKYCCFFFFIVPEFLRMPCLPIAKGLFPCRNPSMERKKGQRTKKGTANEILHAKGWINNASHKPWEKAWAGSH